jgi:hypothetical protein
MNNSRHFANHYLLTKKSNPKLHVSRFMQTMCIVILGQMVSERFLTAIHAKKKMLCKGATHMGRKKEVPLTTVDELQKLAARMLGAAKFNGASERCEWFYKQFGLKVLTQGFLLFGNGSTQLDMRVVDFHREDVNDDVASLKKQVKVLQSQVKVLMSRKKQIDWESEDSSSSEEEDEEAKLDDTPNETQTTTINTNETVTTLHEADNESSKKTEPALAGMEIAGMKETVTLDTQPRPTNAVAEDSGQEGSFSPDPEMLGDITTAAPPPMVSTSASQETNVTSNKTMQTSKDAKASGKAKVISKKRQRKDDQDGKPEKTNKKKRKETRDGKSK